MPATPTDPTLILLTHDRWATRSILNACQPLTFDQLHRKFEIGCGTLHDTTVHIIGALRIWSDTLGQRTVRPWIDEAPRRSVNELLALHAEAAADLAAVALSGPLDQLLQRERLGTIYTYTRATIITHVTTHGMHHRAQMLNMLRHVGVNPLPQSSVVEWSRAGCPES
jgi:uncharacterized damage-inducible protein DinB